MKLWQIIGIGLVCVLVAWVIAVVVLHIGQRHAPAVLGLGSAFEGSLQLPAEKITKTFSDARARMLAVNAAGAHLSLAGTIGAWLSFAATAAITLIVGFVGRAQPAAAAPVNTSGLSTPTARTIGLLAAAAAVLTAFSSLATAKADDAFKHADALRDTIVQSRKAVIDAASAGEAQAVLDDLTLKMAR